MDERGATNVCDLLTMAGDSAGASTSGVRSTYFIVQRGGVPGQMIPLQPGVQSLGRALENEVQIGDMSVSRRHASVLVDEDGLAWLTDAGSTTARL